MNALKRLAWLPLLASVSAQAGEWGHGSLSSKELPVASCLDRLADKALGENVEALSASLAAIKDLSASEKYPELLDKAVSASRLWNSGAHAMLAFELKRQNASWSDSEACRQAEKLAPSPENSAKLAALVDEKNFREEISKKRLIASARAEATNGSKFVGLYDEPSSRSSSSVTYDFPERTLQPGECLYFAIPVDLQKRATNFVVIHHRQDPGEQKGTEGDSKWDSVPGTTSMQVLDSSHSDSWRYWKGPASGARGAKFAEVSHSMEIENLYDWTHYGHAGDRSAKSSNSALHPEGARLCSNGQDPVRVGHLTLKVDPPQADHEEEQIFSSGTSFGSPRENKKLGGGQDFQGLFPGALALGGYSQTKLPAGWKKDANGVSLPLKAGMTLSAVELAAGDSHPDKINNSDGGWGTKGWARLTVQIRRADGTRDVLMNRENVPPEGFLIGTPESLKRPIAEGDRLEIQSQSDVTYLMGLRMSYLKQAPR